MRKQPVTEVEWNYVPTPRQCLAHESPARTVLYGGAMGGGKSYWICAEGIMLSLEYPGNRGYLSRYENATLRKTTLPTLQTLLPTDLISEHNKADQVYRLVNGSEIFYGGLKPTEREQPLSKIKSMDLGWFGIDEASEAAKIYYDILMSRLRRVLPNGLFPRYRGLLTTNPEECWISEMFFPAPPGDCAYVQALPSDNPYLPPGYIESLRRIFPAEWIEKYLKGDWGAIRDEAKRVFPYICVRTAMDRAGYPDDQDVVFGVDVARGGNDESVIAVKRGRLVQIPYAQRDTNRQPDTMRLVVEIEALAMKWKPSSIRVDTVGVGAGVFDRLREKGYPVCSVVAGARAMNPEAFFNLKAELYWEFRKLLQSGIEDTNEDAGIVLPDDKLLASQLCEQKFDILSDKRIKIKSKEELAALGAKSPDRAEAVIFACAKDIPLADQHTPMNIWLI